MASKSATFLASAVIVARNVFRLIVSPYATMRSIAHSWDPYQAGIVWGFVYMYFLYSASIKFRGTTPLAIFSLSMVTFGYFVITFVLMMLYFALATKLIPLVGEGSNVSKKGWRQFFQQAFMLFSYSLIPTLIWFFVTSTLFWVFPPPRLPTLPGALLSIVFVTFSVSMLLWRVTLWYLSLRFLYKTTIVPIVFLMIFFGMWFFPLTVLLYQVGISRVPFI